ncbi:MAG: sugar MFS transporter [Phycisphaerae bacterium]
MSTRATRHRLLIPLAFAAFVSLGLPDGVLGVAWPSVRDSLHVPLDRLGAVLVAGTAGYLASTMVSGTVVRQLGIGRLLLISTALVAGSLGGIAVAPAFWVVAALAVPAGLGAGAIDAGINAFAATRFSAGTVTWLHACYGVGATAGPALMTAALVAAGPADGWRIGYGILAGALGVMGVCFAITLRWWDDPPSSLDAPATPTTAPVTAFDALRRPIVRLHVAIFFVYTGIEVTAGQWVYSWLTEGRGISTTVAGLCVTLFWGGLTAGRVAFGFVARRVDAGRILRWATWAAPLAAGLLALQPPAALTMVACALLGFALGPVYPMMIAVTPARVGPDAAAHAIGFQVSAATLGIAVLPPAAGWLARSAGLAALGPFLIAAAVVLLALHEIARRASCPALTPSSPSSRT